MHKLKGLAQTQGFSTKKALRKNIKLFEKYLRKKLRQMDQLITG